MQSQELYSNPLPQGGLTHLLPSHPTSNRQRHAVYNHVRPLRLALLRAVAGLPLLSFPQQGNAARMMPQITTSPHFVYTSAPPVPYIKEAMVDRPPLISSHAYPCFLPKSSFPLPTVPLACVEFDQVYLHKAKYFSFGGGLVYSLISELSFPSPKAGTTVEHRRAFHVSCPLCGSASCTQASALLRRRDSRVRTVMWHVVRVSCHRSIVISSAMHDVRTPKQNAWVDSGGMALASQEG